MKLVPTLGTGRPKRHFFTTQGPEARSVSSTCLFIDSVPLYPYTLASLSGCTLLSSERMAPEPQIQITNYRLAPIIGPLYHLLINIPPFDAPYSEAVPMTGTYVDMFDLYGNRYW